ncbi:major facilitator superfamily domain-containing protein [Dactylonectria macrodidyma]|uniref:Major facilitator superfamily domain-containing protein n=1 Tax=Dactylonectria macrodidyma TaxID=307937 RepID=A0A9P9FLU1_9HYPO|nr:major facilitator superfamily domain-containing protein [Dactylonectria macrodidyma]
MRGIDDADNDADPAGEGARFLPMDIDDEGAAAAPNEVPKSTQRYVILMCVQFLFIVEFSMFIMEPPLQQIMEDFVCHARYSDHRTGVTQTPDERCKDADVQGTLAMARSWMMWVGMLVPLLVQIPYGIVADRYGRRPVLFLGLFGLVLGTAWYMIVLYHPDAFSIWHLLLGSIPTLIGGGGSVVTAMVWTILSDSIPAARRTSLFYQLHAMMLILSAAFRPVAAWLLSIDPWLPMWIGLAALVVSMFSTLLIPETLHLHKLADEERRRMDRVNGHLADDGELLKAKQSVIQTAWSTTRKDFSRIWHFMANSKHIILLIVAYGLCYPINIAFEMNMLQYVTKRFNWDWSTATYFTTISKVTSVIVLLVLLPLLSIFITKRYQLEILTRDLYLSRGSILFITAGNMFTAVAAAPWMLVISLIVLSLGNGFQPQLRALLAGIVEPHTLATLNTTIATCETLIGLVTVPALGWLLSKGIDLGGVLMGLPFAMTSVFAVLASVAMFTFKLPRGVSQADGRYDH